ncbi:MAG: hypothetical protein HOV94_09075 [Saccharothrix sp.]|nr:hypothetical protein [Saccharothrix sp.]
MSVALRHALRTDRGLVRDANQDGFGDRGEPLSSMAIDTLAPPDTAIPAGDLRSPKAGCWCALHGRRVEPDLALRRPGQRGVRGRRRDRGLAGQGTLDVAVR